MRDRVRAKLDEATRLMLDVGEEIASLRCNPDGIRFAAAFLDAQRALYRAYEQALELPEVT